MKKLTINIFLKLKTVELFSTEWFFGSNCFQNVCTAGTQSADTIYYLKQKMLGKDCRAQGSGSWYITWYLVSEWAPQLLLVTDTLDAAARASRSCKSWLCGECDQARGSRNRLIASTFNSGSYFSSFVQLCICKSTNKQTWERQKTDKADWIGNRYRGRGGRR